MILRLPRLPRPPRPGGRLAWPPLTATPIALGRIGQALRRPSPMLVRLIGLFLLCWLASFLLVRTLLTSRTDRSQVEQMAGILANNIALTELALEHYPPAAVSELNGFQLLVATRPSLTTGADRRLGAQLERLSQDLCDRLGHCPTLIANSDRERGVWIRIRSSLEPVWLFSPLPAQGLFSPDPLVIALSMLGGSVLAGGIFLLLEVQRPLRQLSAAIGLVGTCDGEAMVPVSGSSEVRQLATRFNAMLARLQANEQERRTMLAGITHDLNSPITRLAVRLSLASEALEAAPAQSDRSGVGHGRGLGPRDLAAMSADLGAIQRITQQFLLFASCDGIEPFSVLRLDALLAESCGRCSDQDLSLALTPLTARVQPTAIIRAVANLLDNAEGYGQPPLRLTLGTLPGERFEIRVSDGGQGLSEAAFERAKQPFQRLDPSRGGKGHCGLGLAIAERVARAHGGQLRCERSQPPEAMGFTISLSGRLDPEAGTSTDASHRDAGHEDSDSNRRAQAGS